MGKYMANPRIVHAKLRSEDCAGQSSNCPDPNFVHNMYIFIQLSKLKRGQKVLQREGRLHSTSTDTHNSRYGKMAIVTLDLLLCLKTMTVAPDIFAPRTMEA